MSEPSPKTVILSQLFFGLFFIATGGWLTAEPTLTLTRDEQGAVEYHYAFWAYGRLPVIEKQLEDLVGCKVTESRNQVASPDRVSASPRSRTVTSYNLVCSARNGDSFAIGNAFQTQAILRFLDSSEERIYQERIEATSLRLYGGAAAGLFGVLLLAGGITGVVTGRPQ